MWDGVRIAVSMSRDQTVLDVSPSHAVGAQQDQGLPLVGGQLDDLLVGDEVQTVEDGVVLGEVLVLRPAAPGGGGARGEPTHGEGEALLLADLLAEDVAVHGVALGLFQRLAGCSPFLKRIRKDIRI